MAFIWSIVSIGRWLCRPANSFTYFCRSARSGNSPASRRPFQAEVKKHVAAGSALYSDDLKSYVGLEEMYAHGVIDHAVKYVDGKVHTNGLENFWSLLKRALNGTYVSVEPFHLFRYLDEQAYRFNERKRNDWERFLNAIRGVVGKRLSYRELLAKLRGPKNDKPMFDDNPVERQGSLRPVR